MALSWLRAPRCPACGGKYRYTGYDPGWPFGGDDRWTCRDCGREAPPDVALPVKWWRWILVALLLLAALAWILLTGGPPIDPRRGGD